MTSDPLRAAPTRSASRPGVRPRTWRRSGRLSRPGATRRWVTIDDPRPPSTPQTTRNAHVYTCFAEQGGRNRRGPAQTSEIPRLFVPSSETGPAARHRAVTGLNQTRGHGWLSLATSSDSKASPAIWLSPVPDRSIAEFRIYGRPLLRRRSLSAKASHHGPAPRSSPGRNRRALHACRSNPISGAIEPIGVSFVADVLAEQAGRGNAPLLFGHR